MALLSVRVNELEEQTNTLRDQSVIAQATINNVSEHLEIADIGPII